MPGLTWARASVRPAAVGAILLAIGVSFALVAGAVSVLNSSNAATIQNTLLDPYAPTGIAPQALASTDAGTPGLNAVAAPGATALPPAAGNELSKAQAIALVQGRYRARVVRTTLSQDKGRPLYVFRLLSGSGKVWTVRIDAHTGAEVP
jgi:Peptidase propeptide and YPEB domain